MKISSNFIMFHNELGLKKTIDIFSEVGFEGIDFTADSEEYYTDVHSEEFYKNINNMLGVWFDGNECDEVSEFLTDKIFRYGAFGNYQTGLKSQALVLSKGRDAKGARRRRFWSLVFPPYMEMCSAYSFIKGKPWLLPVAWVYRILKVLLFKRENIAMRKNNMQAINQSTIDSYQAELNFVGLDFNFEV